MMQNCCADGTTQPAGERPLIPVTNDNQICIDFPRRQHDLVSRITVLHYVGCDASGVVETLHAGVER
jgi:hypothetical protein